ncbi:MAG: zinc-binding dehydrogenase [Atribacterota bacterium]|nr:zinc-binding dehydrogenase [Atribacterota bacterium]MDD5637750.1 zinc-binding dehydrogenase [Atribacterota bacterium]
MTKLSKAAVLKAPGEIGIQFFPVIKPGKGAAVCRMIVSGICGTDKHSYNGETLQYKGTPNEIDIPFPIIQGHENVMIIEEIDKEGSKKLEYNGTVLKPGDRVTMCPDVVCGKCYYCKNFPNYPWCDNMQFSYGNMRSCKNPNYLYGGFSEYIYIEPGTRLYKIPDDLPDEMAVLTELMCVTYTLDKAKEFNSFSLEGFNFGDTIVIQGSGPLGLAHIIKARMMGAGEIIVTDVSNYKLDLARQFGADKTLNILETNEDERIDLVMQETQGRGCDLVVECVGKPFVVPEGLKMLRKAGMYLEPGNFVDCGGININIHTICSKNLRIIGMSNHSHTGYKQTMEMMLRGKDRFPWKKFISHQFKLDDAEKAILTSMTDESMKVLIKPKL